MFGHLSDRFSNALRHLSGQGKISGNNVEDAMGEVRDALLEADVHYEVVESFCKKVLAKSLGDEVLQAVEPGQQMIKIVHDELLALMAGDDIDPETGEYNGNTGIMFVQPGPTIIMMSGLQGSGKTTTCGKLAMYLKKQDKSVLLVAADLQRPAAVDQLETVANQANTEGEGNGSVSFYGEREKIAEYGKACGCCGDGLYQCGGAMLSVSVLMW